MDDVASCGFSSPIRHLGDYDGGTIVRSVCESATTDLLTQQVDRLSGSRTVSVGIVRLT